MVTMVIAGRIEEKAIIFLGLLLASVSWVAAAAAASGGGYVDRRGLTDVVPEDFENVNSNPTGMGVNSIDDAPTGMGVNTVGPTKKTKRGVTLFNVKSYGAKADGKTDNSEAFMQAWVAACKNVGRAKLHFPRGTYKTGPVVFQGPCNGSPISVVFRGIIKATADISEYSSPEWFSFENINGLRVYGGGTFDAQGPEVWQYNDCKTSSNCQLLPTTIKFSGVNNTLFFNITSINSMSFHTHVTYCQNFKAHSLNIIAPDESPNTDGMHLSSSARVDISSSKIGTGDDCISVGHGISQLAISKIMCGPGHGISIGSLGKYKTEKDVTGVSVTNCTFTNTTNGARIKTWPASPVQTTVSDITFQDIIMNSVQNPIIIDQQYGSGSKEPSRVKIRDVHFKNIRGTTTSNVAVSLTCSPAYPCDQVELANIDLKFNGNTKKDASISAECSNAHGTTVGTQNPPPCSLN